VSRKLDKNAFTAKTAHYLTGKAFVANEDRNSNTNTNRGACSQQLL
jgi:hypothetical protein